MVVTKAKIVSELAGRSLLLPDLVASALAANGRIKFAISWLQAAEAAAGGDGAAANLETERSLSGLAGDPLYAPPQGASHRADGLFIPGSVRIFERMLDDAGDMRAAVEAGAVAANMRPADGYIVNGRQNNQDAAGGPNGPTCGGMAYDVKKVTVKVGDIVIVPPGVVHGWADIPDHVDYLSFRPSQNVMQDGWVNPTIAK